MPDHAAQTSTTPAPATPAAAAPPAQNAGGGGSVAAEALKALQSNGTGAGAPAAGSTPAATAGAPAATPARAADPTAPTPATATGEIKLTAPKDSGLSDDDVKGIAEFAKANGMTQAQAEKYLEREAGNRQAQTKAQAEAQKQAEQQQLQAIHQAEQAGRKAWEGDPDFGGQKVQESNLDVARVLSKYADPDLQKFLAEHPMGKALGSDPLFLRMLARIGRDFLREDAGAGSPQARGASPRPQSIDDLEKAFYPNGPLGPPASATAAA